MKIQKRGLLRSGIITGADKEGQPLHTFAVCAYKFCLIWRPASAPLTEQQVKTDVICCTSTRALTSKKNYKEICGSSLCAGGREQHQGGLAVCLA